MKGETLVGGILKQHSHLSPGTWTHEVKTMKVVVVKVMMMMEVVMNLIMMIMMMGGTTESLPSEHRRRWEEAPAMWKNCRQQNFDSKKKKFSRLKLGEPQELRQVPKPKGRLFPFAVKAIAPQRYQEDPGDGDDDDKEDDESRKSMMVHTVTANDAPQRSPSLSV